MIKLGDKVKDSITGFEGIVIGVSTWITGCDQYCVAPKAPKGDYKESVWFDEGRLKVVGKGINKNQVKAKKNGGPRTESMPRK